MRTKKTFENTDCLIRWFVIWPKKRLYLDEHSRKCVFYDPSYQNPFRYSSIEYETEPMNASWKNMSFYEDVPWYKNIPKDGILCHVWGSDESDKRAHIITNYRHPDCDYPFGSVDNSFQHAEPLTMKEAEKYLLKE